MGSAKDLLAIKSLVAANVGGEMAIATEEQAMRQVFTRSSTSTCPSRARSSCGSGGRRHHGDR